MANQKLRWGILGVAGINQRLIPAFKASQTAELCGIASRSLEKAQAAAKADQIPQAYASYDALLNDPKIDAVYIPLPNHMHLEWTKKAADAGKHILCEKPMCPTAKECEELVNYCQQKNVRLMDGFMWPHHPRTRKIQETIKAGKIGEVKKVVASFSFNLAGLPTSNIRMQPDAAGGALMDIGCYTTYAIRWWMGAEPVKVYAQGNFVNGVDVAMNGVFTFADGRMANFDFSFTNPLRTWVEIIGSEACIQIPNLWIPDDQAVFQIVRQKGDFDTTAEQITTPGQNQMVHMLNDFAEAVFGNKDCSPHPSQAIKTGKVLDALLLSAKTNLEVKL